MPIVRRWEKITFSDFRVPVSSEESSAETLWDNLRFVARSNGQCSHTVLERSNYVFTVIMNYWKLSREWSIQLKYVGFFLSNSVMCTSGDCTDGRKCLITVHHHVHTQHISYVPCEESNTYELHCTFYYSFILASWWACCERCVVTDAGRV